MKDIENRYHLLDESSTSMSISYMMSVCEIHVHSISAPWNWRAESKKKKNTGRIYWNKKKERNNHIYTYAINNFHRCTPQQKWHTTNVRLISECFTSSLLSGFFTCLVSFSSFFSDFVVFFSVNSSVMFQSNKPKKNQLIFFSLWSVFVCIVFMYEKMLVIRGKKKQNIQAEINCALGFGFMCYGKTYNICC